MKREKQLKSQIDNLITDSLNLLKTRLSELGIQAKTPPEFIEKVNCNSSFLVLEKFMKKTIKIISGQGYCLSTPRITT